MSDASFIPTAGSAPANWLICESEQDSGVSLDARWHERHCLRVWKTVFERAKRNVHANDGLVPHVFRRQVLYFSTIINPHQCSVGYFPKLRSVIIQ